MAVIPDSPDGTSWVIINIEDNILIIENPGMDEEKTHYEFKGDNQLDIVINVRKIQEDKQFTPEQLYWIHLWVGYFYASLYKGGLTNVLSK
jgi:hypothetical protein